MEYLNPENKTKYPNSSKIHFTQIYLNQKTEKKILDKRIFLTNRGCIYLKFFNFGNT